MQEFSLIVGGLKNYIICVISIRLSIKLVRILSLYCGGMVKWPNM